MKRVIGIMTAVLALATIGFSALVVDFNPADLTVGPATKASSENSTTRTWAFSDSVVLIEGPAEHGAKIYGGVQHSVSSGTIGAIGTSTPTISISFDRFQSAAPAVSGQTATDTGILLWNKADFISGSGQLKFDGSAGSQFQLSTTDLGLLGTLSSHFVIKDNDTYYVSDYTMTAIGTHTLSGADHAQWAVFDPTTFSLAATSAYEDRTFNDVQAVGFAYTVSRPNNSTRLWINDFNVSLIPEPASVGLLMLGGGLTLLLRRLKS